MTIELGYLAAVSILTLLIRVPWMLNKVSVRGLNIVVGYPEESAPLSGWAERLWIANEDAIQNLVTFAILVIILHLTGVSNPTTQIATAVYFWARVMHVTAYVFTLRWVKTFAYLTGFGVQIWLAWVLFS